jgi:hypothetical protein
MREGGILGHNQSSIVIATLIVMISSIMVSNIIDEVQADIKDKTLSGFIKVMSEDLVIDGDDDFENNENITGSG